MLRETAERLQETMEPVLRGKTFAPKETSPIFTRPEWWENLELESGDYSKGREGLRLIVKNFVTEQFPQKMKHRASGGNWEFYTKENGTELWMFKNNHSLKVRVLIAKKVGRFFVANASSLQFQKLPKWKSPKAVSSGQFTIQRVLAEVMPMVPFGVFKDAQLDLDTLEVIDKGPDESLELGRKVKGKEVKTHFTGALVFRMDFKPRSKAMRDYKNQGQCFLFDVDRNDLKLKNLNFFLSKLARNATSVADAYASLKPQEVYEAEKFLGHPCERQGEWFFIPVQGRFKRRKQLGWSGRGRPAFVEAVLQAKGNRAHYVKFLSDEGYVTGKVWHGGMEHKPIELKGWFKPVCNTASESFKISGAVD